MVRVLLQWVCVTEGYPNRRRRRTQPVMAAAVPNLSEPAQTDKEHAQHAGYHRLTAKRRLRNRAGRERSWRASRKYPQPSSPAVRRARRSLASWLNSPGPASQTHVLAAAPGRCARPMRSTITWSTASRLSSPPCATGWRREPGRRRKRPKRARKPRVGRCGGVRAEANAETCRQANVPAEPPPDQTFPSSAAGASPVATPPNRRVA